MIYEGFEPVIGLEVHVQLATKTKLFSSEAIQFDAGPNDRVSPICAGHPGTLPVLNKRAVEYAIMAGVALGCEVRLNSVFSRKNYFYPDLPKGYQISQYDLPLCEHGKLLIELSDGSEKEVGITRIHMEEDAGKSIHEVGSTLVNLNRAGVPLVEIVSEPDMRSPEEAGAYLRKLYAVVTYLGICDGNLQEGNFRCDANVSLRPVGESKFGTRAELKNLNSFRFVEKAIEYEMSRQADLLRNGKKVIQETRLYDSDKNVTKSMRSKEEAHDYRYFPEPDLIPLKVTEETISDLRSKLPELPDAKKERFVKEYEIPKYDAGVITGSKPFSHYFEGVLESLGQKDPKAAKLVSNWMMTEVLRVLKEENLEPDQIKISHKAFAGLLKLIMDGTVSGKIAKEVFQKMWESGKSASELVQELGLVQISDEGELKTLIQEVLTENPNQLAQYRSGKDKLFGFFVGQMMKKTQGKANPQLVNELLKEALGPS